MNTRPVKRRRTRRPRLTRIGIIGCGNVAKESVYSLGLSGAANEIILSGRGSRRLRSEVIKLAESFPLENPLEIRTGTPAQLRRCDLVIVAVGKPADPTESFDQHLAANSRLVQTTIERLRPASFRGIVLVTTTPVDQMTQIAQEVSGIPVERVIGVGGTPPWAGGGDVRADDDQEPATWCSAHGSGGQLMDSCQPECPYFEGILREFRGASTHATESLASCVMRVCEAILRDERTLLTVSTKPMGEYGLWGVCVTLPCIISKVGVEQVVEFKRSDADRQKMLDHARELAISNRTIAFLSTPICPEKGLAATPRNQT